MTRYHEAGKGPDRRPQQVSNEEFAERWDAIFGKEKCPICKRELIDGLCPKQLEDQGMEPIE